MLRDRILDAIADAVSGSQRSGLLPESLPLAAELTDTKNPEHGDYATNYAMVNAKAAGANPRALAETVAAELRKGDLFDAVDVAGPGFLNFRVRPAVVAEHVGKILELGDRLPLVANPHPRRLNVEFVSVNPNGPITVGSGRGAAFGDTLCRVLRAAGDEVDAEYYINDALNSQQMRLFAESVRYYLALAAGVQAAFPEGGYKGDYVSEVADALRERALATWQTPVEETQRAAEAMMLEAQRRDLAEFGVTFDRWFSEQSLHDSGAVESAIQQIERSGAADREPHYFEWVMDGKERRLEMIDSVTRPTDSEYIELEGPLWLRSAQFGDEKDRVLVRSDGRPAYIAGDLAYMEDKLGKRHYGKALLILGPDHHGYIGRMNAVVRALGHEAARFEIILYQLVRFVKEGKPAPMRKRDGNIYELRDLVKEIGVDAARFFYLMRNHDTSMDFDIDLATKRSDDNPVYYVQYAHARISSVLAKAGEAGFAEGAWSPSLAGLLTHPTEMALIKKALDLPEEVKRAATDFGVHRLTTYAVELSRTYHHFYDACRVIQPDQPELSQARLCVCRAAQIALRGTLALLGVSAPDRM
ncbi:MAG TPA: arginine--tRNA ligase [Fimbriimonadaceae bacterium]|nr:arginine--tRNA ligase [Fimbriimonadaceae bacterium]